MDLIELGAQLLRDRLGLDVDTQTIRSALASLVGDGSGQLDFSALAAKMAANGELDTLLGSWLGDGANQAISVDAISDLFGPDALSRFAGRVGVDDQAAAAGLADIVPELMDRASSGGKLLEAFAGGSAGGLLDAAKSFLR